MSYSEEQTRDYNAMLYAFEMFDKIKRELSKSKCLVHNKRLTMNAIWENEYDVDITISKYCCLQFATQIAKQFVDVNLFASVSIEKQ